jgi:hypothetical protein
MRKVLVAVAAIAVGGFLITSASADMPTTHDLGGPIQMGKMCWAQTDGNGVAGYWRDCPKAAKPMKMKKKMSKK